MASAAIPMLVGTGISLLGARAGWDPRLTALASMAGGGIAGGMASGAFGSAAGSAAGASAPGVGMTGSLFSTGTTPTVLPAASSIGQGFFSPGSSVALTPASTGMLRGAGGLGGWGLPDTAASLSAVTQPAAGGLFGGTSAGTATLGGITQPTMSTPAAQSGFSKWITGPQGKQLGADMLKTFLDYEIALANEPPQRLRSGGGGGGGGGRAPAYPGGGQTGQKSVVWSYPQATGMYQPKALA